MATFDEVKNKLGFGCMRLPMIGPFINTSQFKKMIDVFMDAGFNYFDTAHCYHMGHSETALKKCLTTRYPRESFVLTDKLTSDYFKTEADIRPFFEKQLALCGVDYFDFYLMHSQNAAIYEKFVKTNAYKVAAQLKAEGKVRHFGLSFHDKADVLDRILTEQPEVEVVQIQFNYVDYDDPSVESRKCYDVCRKHGKPMIVMEPVRGGSLARLTDDANGLISSLNGGSPASYAIRYAASFEGIFMVLSGMSNMSQLVENVGFMRDFKPLNDLECETLKKVAAVFHGKGLIPCTACHYCTEGCPKHIAIPELFSCVNSKKVFKDWNSDCYYRASIKDHGKPSDCIGCGKCEVICPQHLKVRDLLKTVNEEFGKIAQ